MNEGKVKKELESIIVGCKSIIDNTRMSLISLRRHLYNRKDKSDTIIGELTNPKISDSTIIFLKNDGSILLKFNNEKYFVSYELIPEPDYFDTFADNRRDYCSVYVDAFRIGKVKHEL